MAMGGVTSEQKRFKGANLELGCFDKDSYKLANNLIVRNVPTEVFSSLNALEGVKMAERHAT
jgi:hypothetical protein